MSYYKILVIFSVIQYVPLAYFKSNHLYLLIPYPFNDPDPSLTPLVTASLFSISMCAYFLLYSLFCCIFRSTYKWYHAVFVFMCLTYFTQHVCVSHSVVSNSLWPHPTSPGQASLSLEFSKQETGVDCHSLLQRIFPTQGLNPGLLHCKQILYCLSYREVLNDKFLIT